MLLEYVCLMKSSSFGNNIRIWAGVIMVDYVFDEAWNDVLMHHSYVCGSLLQALPEVL